MLFREIVEILKNRFLAEYLRASASDNTENIVSMPTPASRKTSVLF